MIERVEVSRILRRDLEGIFVTFVYDTNVSDSYEILEPHHMQLLDMIADAPDPAMFMMTIRNLMNLTIH